MPLHQGEHFTSVTWREIGCCDGAAAGAIGRGPIARRVVRIAESEQVAEPRQLVVGVIRVGGRLVLNVLMSVAAWEREAIGERTREALRHKIRCNQRCGKVRFGYNLAGDGKTLVVNLVEQEAIVLMTSLRAAGHTLRQIATELTGRGIQTKEGGAWTHTTVARILQRKVAA